MLEAIVSLRRRNKGDRAIGAKDTVEKKRGDIIAVKIPPCVWGRKERKHFLIIKLVDQPLETEMVAAGQTRRIYPYGVYKDRDGVMMLVNRSRRRVDLTEFAGTDSLDPDVPVDAVDREGKPRLTKADLILDSADRI